MQVHWITRGVELSQEFREHAERRLLFRLGRFAGRIRGLRIRLRDVNGPRGGVDQACDIRVDAGLDRPIIVKERQAGPHLAVALAAERAAETLRRELHATRTLARQPAR